MLGSFRLIKVYFFLDRCSLNQMQDIDAARHTFGISLRLPDSALMGAES